MGKINRIAWWICPIAHFPIECDNRMQPSTTRQGRTPHRATSLGPNNRSRGQGSPAFALDERSKPRPINFRETARRRVLTGDNINSDATWLDMTHRGRSGFSVRTQPDSLIEYKTRLVVEYQNTSILCSFWTNNLQIFMKLTLHLNFHKSAKLATQL